MPTSPQIIAQAVAGVITALLVAAWLIATSRSIGWVFAGTINAILLLIGQFSVWYSSYGTRANWSPPLTRLDSLQVSLGTLTTAGLAGITPRSELARRLITVQLTVDILAAIVLFGLFVARVAEWRRPA